MATIGSAEARCLNCKTEVRKDDDNCRKCGDRVKPRPRLELVEATTEEFANMVPNGWGEADTGRDWNQGPGDVTPATPVAPAAAVQLTEEQAAAIEKVRDWYACRGIGIEPFRLFGPAGTGKTTLARHVGPALGLRNVVFGTFTGKAARVLRSKGVPATTIHSAIYALDFRTEKRARLAAAERELMQMQGETTDPVTAGWADALELAGAISEISEEIETLRAELRRPAFTLNRLSEWAYADLIVLDEVSMVNEKIAHDIESFGVPVLVLGDPAQLPPIEGGGHYTATTPDVLLETVHRQALESPVLALATHVRLGGSWADRLVKVNLAEAMAADQILVWKNATRWSLIRKIREKRGLPAAQPVAGDRVMCLVNNKDLGVFNGQQFEVMDVKGGPLGSGIWELELLDEDGRRGWYGAMMGGFKGLEAEQEAKRGGAFRGEIGLFTWADVVTCHKAQGSEWPDVYVVDQTEQMWKSTAAEKRAWMYTAVSRASHKVTLASTNA
jgi:exodeoxyribonuclease-5